VRAGRGPADVNAEAAGAAGQGQQKEKLAGGYWRYEKEVASILAA